MHPTFWNYNFLAESHTSKEEKTGRTHGERAMVMATSLLIIVIIAADASPIIGAARKRRFSDCYNLELTVTVMATAMSMVVLLMFERRRPSRVLRVRRDPLTRQDTSLPPSVHCRPHYVNR